ncbi:hypothetical protein Tco_0431751 [Tanacetum coccineum]
MRSSSCAQSGLIQFDWDLVRDAKGYDFVGGGGARRSWQTNGRCWVDVTRKSFGIGEGREEMWEEEEIIGDLGATSSETIFTYVKSLITADIMVEKEHAECTGSIIQALHALKNLHPDGRRSGGSGRLSSLAAVKGAEVVGCVQDRTDVSIRVE